MTLKWQDYIEERKDVMLGKPVLKDTRLTVEFILKQIGAGMTHEALLDQYPTSNPNIFAPLCFTRPTSCLWINPFISDLRESMRILADENVARQTSWPGCGASGTMSCLPRRSRMYLARPTFVQLD